MASKKNQGGGALAPPMPRSGRQQRRGGDDRRRVPRGTPVPGKAYTRIGGGRFRNTKQGNPRQGQVFTMGAGGAHVYQRGGKTLRIGGGKAAPAPTKRKQGGGPTAKIPFDVTAPITDPKAIAREVESMAQLRYRPQFAELDRQAQAENNRTTNLGSYYDDFLRRLEQAGARTDAAFSGAQQAAYGQANQAAAADESRRTAALAAAREAAGKVGARVDESVYEQARQGGEQRQAQGTAMGGLIGAQGANQAAYGQGQIGVGAAQKLTALRGQQDKASELARMRRELLGDRGEFKVKSRADLIDRERRAVLENQAFGLDAQKAALDAADDAADNAAARARLRTTRRGQNITRRGQDISAETQRRGQDLTDARSRRNGGRGGSSDFRTAKGYGRTGVSLAKGTSNRATFLDLVERAKAGSKPPDSANRALVKAVGEYVRGNGGVSPATARSIYKNFGFKVKIKKKPKKVKVVGGIPIIDGKPRG